MLHQTKEENHLFNVSSICDDAYYTVITYSSEPMYNNIAKEYCIIDVFLEREHNLKDIGYRFYSVEFVRIQPVEGNLMSKEFLPALLADYHRSGDDYARAFDVPKLVLQLAITETFGSIQLKQNVCEICKTEDPYVSFSQKHGKNLCWKCCG